MRTLDLGCGTAKTAGAIGIDVVPLKGVDVVADLRQRPYPFAENSFDAIHLNDIIEHIPDTIRTVEECWRLLRPDGRAYVRVVNWNSVYTAMDPTHINAYTECSFDFFGKRVGRSYYSAARFDVVKVERGFNGLARRFCDNDRLLYFFSNYLSNVLEDLNFELRAVKPAQAQPEPAHDVEAEWFPLLRCPAALATGKSGLLRRARGTWLISDESGLRYPIRSGVPIMTLEEGSRWAKVAEDALPEPEPIVHVPVEDKAIESIGNADFPHPPILTVQDFLQELTKTYGPGGDTLREALQPLIRETIEHLVREEVSRQLARLHPRRVIAGVGRRLKQLVLPSSSNAS